MEHVGTCWNMLEHVGIHYLLGAPWALDCPCWLSDGSVLENPWDSSCPAGTFSVSASLGGSISIEDARWRNKQNESEGLPLTHLETS